MDTIEIRSISQLHEMLHYGKPRHPLLTVIDYDKLEPEQGYYEVRIVPQFYIVSMKTPAPSSVRYGRKYYDFSEGTMMFMAPGQVFSVDEFREDARYQGWGLYFHPDLIRRSELQHRMEEYAFFSYASHEALHVSESERVTLNQIIQTISSELDRNIDAHTETLLLSSIRLLLDYCNRFYGRQFITRRPFHNDVLARFEQLLNEYKWEGDLPTVGFFADHLHLSQNYLSDLLKKETGKTTKEHIQLRLIERAKDLLLATDQTVSEIAYTLGFEYPQYFSRLFKERTGMTPLEYRSMN